MITDTYIYVIDDDVEVLRSIEFLFCSLGIEAFVFKSGHQFLCEMDNLWPGCVLIDLTLPGRGGLEVQKELRSSGRFWPLIFMSGSPDFGDWEAAKATDAIACLPKPFSDEELLGAVHRAYVELRRARLSAAGAVGVVG